MPNEPNESLIDQHLHFQHMLRNSGKRLPNELTDPEFRDAYAEWFEKAILNPHGGASSSES